MLAGSCIASISIGVAGVQAEDGTLGTMVGTDVIHIRVGVGEVVRACLRPGAYDVWVLMELLWIYWKGTQGDGSLLNA